MTRSQFAKGMLVLTETFAATLTPVQSAAYWDALSELDAAAWETAVRLAVKRSVHFPRPAELRAFAPPPPGWRCPHDPPCHSVNWCQVVSIRAGERKELDA